LENGWMQEHDDGEGDCERDGVEPLSVT
jgi:hypothetical protein